MRFYDSKFKLKEEGKVNLWKQLYWMYTGCAFRHMIWCVVYENRDKMAHITKLEWTFSQNAVFQYIYTNKHEMGEKFMMPQ